VNEYWETVRRRREAPVYDRSLADLTWLALITALALVFATPALADTFSDADWVSMNSSLPGANSSVLAVAVDGDGNVYVGGSFTVIGAVAANHIAKWNGTSWTALGSGMNSTVYALTVSGTNLYAGGAFTNAGGVATSYVAKWNGSAWSALDTGMSGPDPYVYALVVNGTNLLAGGAFTNAGGASANNIAKWDGISWSAVGSGLNGTVRALAASGTELYAGGLSATPAERARATLRNGTAAPGLPSAPG